MAEWLKALVLKTRDLERGPGVRIPFPPNKNIKMRRGGRVAEGARLLIVCTGDRTESSNLFLSVLIFLPIVIYMLLFGEMAEWLKAHAWKACVGYPYRGFESPSLRSFSLDRQFPKIALIFSLVFLSINN